MGIGTGQPYGLESGMGRGGFGAPPRTLSELAVGEEPEPAGETARSTRSRCLLGCAAVAVLVGAFCMGRISVPGVKSHSPLGEKEISFTLHTPSGLVEGAHVTVPVGEDGTVYLEMPLSAPGEEFRLAAQLEFYKWPEY